MERHSEFLLQNEACTGTPSCSLTSQMKGGDNVKKLIVLYLIIKLVKSLAELVRAVADLIRAINSR